MDFQNILCFFVWRWMQMHTLQELFCLFRPLFSFSGNTGPSNTFYSTLTEIHAPICCLLFLPPSVCWTVHRSITNVFTAHLLFVFRRFLHSGSKVSSANPDFWPKMAQNDITNVIFAPDYLWLAARSAKRRKIRFSGVVVCVFKCVNNEKWSCFLTDYLLQLEWRFLL